MYYAGHITRNTSSGDCDSPLRTIILLYWRLQAKLGTVKPRRTLVDDLIEWTGSKQFEKIKRAAERRNVHGTFATHSRGSNIEWMNLYWTLTECMVYHRDCANQPRVIFDSQLDCTSPGNTASTRWNITARCSDAFRLWRQCILVFVQNGSIAKHSHS